MRKLRHGAVDNIPNVSLLACDRDKRETQVPSSGACT